VADRVHDLQFDQPFGQQAQRPGLAALRRRRAGHRDQARLGAAIELAFPAGAVLRLATERGLKAVLDKALAESLPGRDAELQGLGNALVGPRGAAVGGIGLEPNAGVGQLPGSGLSGRAQVLQLLAFLGGPGNFVSLPGLLPKRRPYQENPCSCTTQVESDRLLVLLWMCDFW
jgi:hypothetical protein